MQAKKIYFHKLKRNKSHILGIILLLSLSLSLLQVTTSLAPSFHSGWMVSPGDKVQYSVAYQNTTAINSIIDTFIDELNLSPTNPLKLVINDPLVFPYNLTKLASQILGFNGTTEISIETDRTTTPISSLLLPIAIPIVNWDNLINKFKQLQDNYTNITGYYSFFKKQISLNFTQKTAINTTMFVFVWSTDFGILESFFCKVTTQNLSEMLLLEMTRRNLNYKNELRGKLFYILDYGFFLIPAIANFFIPLLLFSQMDYGKKGTFKYILKKSRFLGKSKKDGRKLSEYIFILLFFICVALIYGFLLGFSFHEIPEYKYIPLFSLQIIFPLALGLILSVYEINILNSPKEEGAIVIIYPCYSYITGVAVSDLLSLLWKQTTLFLLFPIALFIVIAYHIIKLRRRIQMST